MIIAPVGPHTAPSPPRSAAAGATPPGACSRAARTPPPAGRRRRRTGGRPRRTARRRPERPRLRDVSRHRVGRLLPRGTAPHAVLVEPVAAATSVSTAWSPRRGRRRSGPPAAPPSRRALELRDPRRPGPLGPGGRRRCWCARCRRAEAIPCAARRSLLLHPAHLGLRATVTPALTGCSAQAHRRSVAGGRVEKGGRRPRPRRRARTPPARSPGGACRRSTRDRRRRSRSRCARGPERRRHRRHSPDVRAQRGAAGSAGERGALAEAATRPRPVRVALGDGRDDRQARPVPDSLSASGFVVRKNAPKSPAWSSSEMRIGVRHLDGDVLPSWEAVTVTGRRRGCTRPRCSPGCRASVQLGQMPQTPAAGRPGRR